jgi:lysophospholipid acyltransferase (LPLAT)-like uncharacterized protein
MKKWLIRKIVPCLAAGIIHTLAATLRIRLDDPHGFLKNIPSGPMIFAFWHNRLLLMPRLCQFFLPQRRFIALISRSGDGEVITEICAKFGIKAVRGSSSRQGAIAFRELVRLVEKERFDVAITPDGPRGPRYQVQPGILQLSQMTGCPIIPTTYDLSSKWEMPSWDRFQVPKPFSRCRLVVGEPFIVPASAEDLSSYSVRLAKAMGEDF